MYLIDENNLRWFLHFLVSYSLVLTLDYIIGTFLTVISVITIGCLKELFDTFFDFGDIATNLLGISLALAVIYARSITKKYRR